MVDMLLNVTTETLESTCPDRFHRPEFDEERAMTLPADVVRATWPRSAGRCPTCGFYGVVYASMAHYVAGDW